MARHFTITTPSETVRVGPDGRGEMAFTVTNVSGFRTRGLGKITALGNTNAEWLALSEVEREFPAGGVEQFRVTAKIPPGTPAGRYTWRFDVVSAVKSSESIDVGPTVAFEVAASEPKKKGIPWWVWLAIAITAIVLGVVAYLVFRPKPKPIDPIPPVEQVEVPKVEGLDRASAIASLQAVGLKEEIKRIVVLTPSRQVNRVIDQSPDAGTKVDKGAQVTITIVVLRGRRPRPDAPTTRDHRKGGERQR